MDQNTAATNGPVTKAGGTRPTAIDLFSKSFEAIKVNLPLHLLFYFAPLIVMAVFVFVAFGSLVLTGMFTGFDPNGSGDAPTGEISGGWLASGSFVWAILLFVVMVAVAVVSYLANTYVGLQGAQGKKTDAGTAVRATTKYIGSLVLLGLLVGAAIMAGFLLLIIPGVIISIYFWPRLMILPVVMVRENLMAFDAYRRSDKIVKAGGVWEVALVSLAIGFIGIIPLIGGLVSAVISFLYSLAPTLRVLEASPKGAAAPAPPATPATTTSV
jgi:hypothetical protein